MTTQATGPSLRETLREVDAAIAEIIRAEVADPAERERLLAKLTALSQPAASASLDVDRLARAIEAADLEITSPVIGQGWVRAPDAARLIAAAYAAIPATDSEEKK